MNNTQRGVSIFFNFKTIIYCLVFFTLRTVSFLLNEHIILNSTVTFMILLCFGVLYFYKKEMAFIVLIGELLLGGSGQLLEFFGLSIRTLLLISFILMFGAQSIIEHTLRNELYNKLRKYSTLIIPVLIFSLFIILSILIGSSNGHSPLNIYHDLVPLLYLLLIFPGITMLQSRESRDELLRLLTVYIFASMIFSIFNLFIFSTHTVLLHDSYYNWFRDVLNGKITNMGTGFFRIVLPEHLLIVPFMLIIGSLLMRDERHHILWWMAVLCGSIILTINFSRTYLLAYIVSFFFLSYRHQVHKWVSVTLRTLLIGCTVFILIQSIASGGSTIGIDVLFGKLSGIINPETEISTYTRSALLSPILNTISNNPLLGIGIGSSIIFINPTTHLLTQTTEYDWGLLEIIAEFGFLGLVSLMLIIVMTIIELIHKIRSVSSHPDIYIGMIGALISLIIMSITSPAIFHLYGIVFLSFTIIFTLKSLSIHDYINHTLYRLFRKLPHLD